MQILAYIALMVVSYFVASALAPKPQEPKAATLDEIDIPQAEEGTPQVVVFGDVWIEGWMVLGYGNYAVEPIRK